VANASQARKTTPNYETPKERRENLEVRQVEKRDEPGNRVRISAALATVLQNEYQKKANLLKGRSKGHGERILTKAQNRGKIAQKGDAGGRRLQEPRYCGST